MPTFRIDDRVRVRDSEREDWKTGLVTELRGDKPVVKLQGQSRGFTWTFVEHADGGGGDRGRGGGGGGGADVMIGDTVRVRDNEREDWKTGTVTEMRGNKPVVKLQGQSRGFTWTFFEPLGGGGKSDRAEKKSGGGGSDDIMIGDTVRVRDNEREDWKTGTVTEMRG
eukprot:Rhum_TRINITY_DN15091_c0_g2::Rhum_TRINITY_DN15091_c0_g2_i3::g.136529::m.136529